MYKQTFEKSIWEDLVRVFDLEKRKDSEMMKDWLHPVVEISEQTKIELNRLNQLMIDNFWNWNEDELKMQFISPLLYLVNYNDHEDKYHPFSQRLLKMETEEIELSGKVEWLLASGKQIPREPFFFLHEYKKEQGTEADPLGQILAAMLTAQHLNQKEQKILYGTYIVGKDWYFLTLQGKYYENTLAYNVTEYDKLEKVFAILTQVKSLVLS